MKDRVLLVDEEPRLLAALSRRLCKYFDVTVAAGNEDALDLLRNAGPFAVAIRTEHDRCTEPFLAKLEEQAPGTGRMVFGDARLGPHVQRRHIRAWCLVADCFFIRLHS